MKCSNVRIEPQASESFSDNLFQQGRAMTVTTAIAVTTG